MSSIIKYKVENYGSQATVHIPELYGKPIMSDIPYDLLLGDDSLEIEYFEYEADFNGFHPEKCVIELEPADSGRFCDIVINKRGGSGETARGDEYCEDLTSWEVEYIIKQVINATLDVNYDGLEEM